MIAAGRSGSAGVAQEQLGRGVDRGERVAQLVPEHREELVARADRGRELVEQLAHPVLPLRGRAAPRGPR